ASGDDPDPARFLHSRHKNYSALDRAAVISLYFPGEREYVARQIMFLLVLSILFILMVCAGFGYVILTINRQKKLSELKNDFINNLTHEFKTPIFSISLASKLLGRSEEINSSEKLNKYLNLIHNENNRLRTQVDKVLQMALIDSGNFHLNRKEVDIHAIIEQVCDAFSVMIEEKEGSIRLQLGAENKLLYADEAHLANLIYNLVDNGIKYSSGPPDITVATADTNEGLCLVIKDKGIGMDEHIQKHVFDKFYRARNGDLHEVKGFGLGLSYVKSIVKAHKGLIRLNSTKNAGSEFIITLPIN
ncbi:MAG: sensor histidine kinase, partial [Balneolaceae bacterium]